MSELYFLPARNGDAFFLHCQIGDEEGWIVVDGGPLKLKNKSIFLQEVEKLPHIDLMVLSHHDNDHIAGVLAYVKEHKKEKPFPVKKLWVNCARHIDISQGGVLSASQASSLADALNEIQGECDIEWKDYITEGFDTSDIKYANIKILSPNEDLLKKYIAGYEKEIGGVALEEGLLLSAQQEADDLKVSLRDLAKKPKPKINENNYHILVNMASIVFVLFCDGLSVLMLGDSFSQQVIDALIADGVTKDNKLKVDFVKVAHHGSKYNISNDLLDMIDCRNFLISTDGGKGETCHPSREALANIICHPERNYGETVHLHFNYSLQSIKDKNGVALFNEGEEEEYNFMLHEPNEDDVKNLYRATCY